MLKAKGRAAWPDTDAVYELPDRHLISPEDHPGCDGEGKDFSYRGKKADYQLKTCKKFGEIEGAKNELTMKLYEPNVCPHEATDHRESSKTTFRTFCLQ